MPTTAYVLSGLRDGSGYPDATVEGYIFYDRQVWYVNPIGTVPMSPYLTFTHKQTAALAHVDITDGSGDILFSDLAFFGRTEIPYTNFVNNWDDPTTDVSYEIDINGNVQFFGKVVASGVPGGINILNAGTLPVIARPSKVCSFVCVGAAGSYTNVGLVIQTDGVIKVISGQSFTAGDYTDLSPIRYKNRNAPLIVR